MKTETIKLKTKGNTDIIDITRHIENIVQENSINDGIIFLSVIGSTAAITTMEYEPGQVKDTKMLLDNIIPYKSDWAHNETWADDNGHSHLRSSFLKTSFFVSVSKGKLDLGTWQQIVLIDFDTKPRDREVVAKIME